MQVRARSVEEGVDEQASKGGVGVKVVDCGVVEEREQIGFVEGGVEERVEEVEEALNQDGVVVRRGECVDKEMIERSGGLGGGEKRCGVLIEKVLQKPPEGKKTT